MEIRRMGTRITTAWVRPATGCNVPRRKNMSPAEWEDLVARLTSTISMSFRPRVLLALERNGLIWLKGNSMTRLGQAQGCCTMILVGASCGTTTAISGMNTPAAWSATAPDGPFTHFNKGTGLFGLTGLHSCRAEGAQRQPLSFASPRAGRDTFFKVETPGAKPVLVIKNVRIPTFSPEIPLAATAAALRIRHRPSSVSSAPSTSRESPTRCTNQNSSPSTANGRSHRRQLGPLYNLTARDLHVFGHGQQWRRRRGASGFGAAQPIFFNNQSPFWKKMVVQALQSRFALGVIGLIGKIRVSVRKSKKEA